MIRTDGIVRSVGIQATNGTFSGIVNANGGIFDNIIINSNAVFSGTINSGPLYASNESIITTSKTFSSGTSISTIWNSLGRNGDEQVFTVGSGSYGAKSGLIAISFIYQYTPINPGISPSRTYWSMALIFQDDTRIGFASYSGIPTIDALLTIGGGSGKTLRFVNLPVSHGNNVGDVYRIGRDLKITIPEDLI
jgi:hypothetical protein